MARRRRAEIVNEEIETPQGPRDRVYQYEIEHGSVICLSLRELREIAALSANEVARRTSITLPTYKKLETGRNQMKVWQAVNIAELYGVSLATVIYGHLKNGGI